MIQSVDGRVTDGHEDGVQGVRLPAHQRGGLQITCPHPHRHGQQLTSDGGQPEEVNEEVVTYVPDPREGGGECKYVLKFFKAVVKAVLLFGS